MIAAEQPLLSDLVLEHAVPPEGQAQQAAQVRPNTANDTIGQSFSHGLASVMLRRRSLCQAECSAYHCVYKQMAAVSAARFGHHPEQLSRGSMLEQISAVQQSLLQGMSIAHSTLGFGEQAYQQYALNAGCVHGI